jgi:hypothetical protein
MGLARYAWRCVQLDVVLHLNDEMRPVWRWHAPLEFNLPLAGRVLCALTDQQLQLHPASDATHYMQLAADSTR